MNMKAITATIKRGTIVALATGCVVLGGASAASASTTSAAADLSCVQQGVEHTIHDPVGAVTGTLEDPAGTLQTEISCVESVLGL